MDFWLSNSPLGGLPRIKNGTTHRASSYDVTGGNKDHWSIGIGKTCELLSTGGAGFVRHIWIATRCYDPMYLRKLVLEMYWDGETNPSVRAPLGDFFGVGHANCKHYCSLPLNMVGSDRIGPKGPHSCAMNCYFPMPFGKGARIQLINQSAQPVANLYFMIDYELTDEPIPEDMGRFHALFNIEKPCAKVIHYGETWPGMSPNDLPGYNLTGDENYIILEAEGTGHYVGCVLSIDNFDASNQVHTWPGEGDDMIFIDGERWPPSLHGTGTEDYFNSAWGFPCGEYSMPYHGVSLGADVQENFGKWTMYRFHVEDPVRFSKSIRVTIEHGHANDQGNDYSSVAYWYQLEPHKPAENLADIETHLPRRWPEHGLWDK